MSRITLLLLDLDDTLLDTSNLLAPAAHREAVLAMMQAGLPGAPDELLAERLSLSATVPPDGLSRIQAAAHGVTSPEVAEAGDRAYFDREVPPIELEAGVEPMLRRLGAERRLVLVTSGVESTQRAKVDRLGLHWLDEQVYAPVGGIEVKQAVFTEALARSMQPADACVVVGDRLDSEILAANRLGMWAIHVDRGEGARRYPRVELGEAQAVIPGPLGIEGAVAALEARRGRGERPLRRPTPD